MTLAALNPRSVLAAPDGKPGYQNTDEPQKPSTDQPPKEFPDERGPNPDGRPPERASG